MKRHSVILCIFLFLPVLMNAQDSFADKFRSFQHQSVDSYRRFNEACNSQYVEFLKLAWESFHSETPVPLPDYDELPPVVLDTAITIIDNEIPVEPVIEYELALNPVVIPEYKEKPSPVPNTDKDRFSFVFYGTELAVKAPDDIRFTLRSCDGQGVAEAWEHLMDSPAGAVLDDCEVLRAKLRLCDWGWLQLLRTFSESFFGKGNEASLMTAFLYCQSGYSMRLGVQRGRLSVLFSTPYVIYGRPYYKISGKKFFSLDAETGDMTVPDFAFPDERDASLALAAVPEFALCETEPRTISICSGCSVQTSVNGNLLDFYSDYPESQYADNTISRWAIYANAPLSASAAENLYSVIRQKIEGLSPCLAVSLLLDFVQNAFEYEYDEKIWGRDRAFFAEETLHYPYADCEDRAILFSHLVRDLVGLDVALIYYPGHLATAVNFPTAVEGDYIMMKGRRFTVCDPTYIGAPVGATMPGMNNYQSKAILLAR